MRKISHLSQLQKLALFGSLIIILCILFFILFGTRASADTGDIYGIHGYEQVLVRPGDTLDGLAVRYSARLSHMPATEYKQHIIRLNNLASDYLREGVYLIMPVCTVVETS